MTALATIRAPEESRSLAQRRAEKTFGLTAAIEWRESRRCQSCGALAYRPCRHRPNGALDGSGAVHHMPFADHRTCAEWRA